MVLDEDLHETMARFSAAAEAQPLELPSIQPPDRVLVAFDGSNQDDSMGALGAALCQRYGARPVLTLGRSDREASAVDGYLERMAERMGLACDLAPASAGDDPVEALLAAKHGAGASVVVMDAPYLEDFGSLGRESVGSIAERVIARTTGPVLLVRSPAAASPGCLDRPLVVLRVTDPGAPAALAHALLLGGRGSFRLLFIVDADAIAEAVAILRSEIPAERLTPESLLNDAQVAAGSLVAMAQRHAAAHGLDLKVDFKSGRDSDIAAYEASSGGHLLVLPCPRDSRSAGYSRALAILRLSTMPVLLI